MSGDSMVVEYRASVLHDIGLLADNTVREMTEEVNDARTAINKLMSDLQRVGSRAALSVGGVSIVKVG